MKETPQELKEYSQSHIPMKTEHKLNQLLLLIIMILKNMKILLILHHLELYQQQKNNSSFFGRNPENQPPPPSPKLEEHKLSEGIKIPFQTTPENEEGSF